MFYTVPKKGNERYGAAISLLTVLVLLSLFLGGCIDGPEKEGEVRTFIDEAGNSVDIAGTPVRLVSLAPSVTEILYFLGLGDRIVGVDSASDHPTEAGKKQVVSSLGILNAETLLMVEPDLVVMDKTLDMSGSFYRRLKDAGMTVYQLFPHDIYDVTTQLKVLANITGVYSAVAERINALEERIRVVEDSSGGIADPPKVLYINYYDGTDDPWVGSRNTVSGDLIHKSGGEALIDDSTGIYLQVSMETVIIGDPDIIITSSSDKWWNGSKEAILKDERLGSIKAVRNENVYDVNADLVERPGPRLVDGLEAISEIILRYGGYR
jgi:iron complex transport system substrate-binding protein